MLIKVTEKHIRDGKKVDCLHCPVALAIREHIPNALVGPCYMTTWEKGDTPFPPEVTRFIRSFDLNEHVEPFEFEL